MVTNTQQTKIQKRILTVIMCFLGLHLIYSNTSLLIDLHKTIYEVSELSAWQNITKIAFAISYSVMTVLILAIYPKLAVISFSALFDGFAIYLKYNIFQNYFVPTSAVYFGLYTAFIVIVAGFISAKYFNSNKADTSEFDKYRLISDLTRKNTPQIITFGGQGEDKNENNEELLKAKRRLINSINATKDETKKAQKIEELKKIEEQLNQ